MADTQDKIITSPRARKYVYGVVVAAISVAVAVGLITEEQAVTVGSSVLGLLAAILALPNVNEEPVQAVEAPETGAQPVEAPSEKPYDQDEEVPPIYSED